MRPTLIIRHPKERLSKCSLRGLESRDDLVFRRFPKQHDVGKPVPGLRLDELQGRVVLRLDAPPLSAADREAGLLLIDGTWRLAAKMLAAVDTWPGLTLVDRSLPPGTVTAYPRRQTDCPDPDAGLASVEALVIAHHILGLSTDGLLAHYHWGDTFLDLNPHLRNTDPASARRKPGTSA